MKQMHTIASLNSKSEHDVTAATNAVLAWYDQHGRDLPWRKKQHPAARQNSSITPYHVWLSEIMLQQTTVATVKSYFAHFTQHWPNIGALAAAPRDEVLSAWAGLGYYARARNLHQTAQIITDEFGGVFPQTETELRRLPGIGEYTAAAIVAFAFGHRAVVVDGNIERILSRWAKIETLLPKARPEIYSVMDRLTPQKRAGDFAQAMMDIGALICTPPRKMKRVDRNALSSPYCEQCPLAATCSVKGEDPAQYPRRPPKKTRPERHGIVLVVLDSHGHVALERRGDKGMLGGLDVFPGSAWADGSPSVRDYPILPDTPVAELVEAFGYGHISNREVEHVFTHFKVFLRVHIILTSGDKPSLPQGLRWVRVEDLTTLALPTVMTKVIKQVSL